MDYIIGLISFVDEVIKLIICDYQNIAYLATFDEELQLFARAWNVKVL